MEVQRVVETYEDLRTGAHNEIGSFRAVPTLLPAVPEELDSASIPISCGCERKAEATYEKAMPVSSYA